MQLQNLVWLQICRQPLLLRCSSHHLHWLGDPFGNNQKLNFLLFWLNFFLFVMHNNSKFGDYNVCCIMYDQARPGDFSQGGRILGPPWELCTPPGEGGPRTTRGGWIFITQRQILYTNPKFSGGGGKLPGGGAIFFPRRHGNFIIFSLLYIQ